MALTLTPAINVSLVNHSTLFPDANLPALANALQIQVLRDFFPVWGTDARIFYTPTGKNPTASHWTVALLDDADQAGALGYHDVTPTGLPLGKAFVRTTQADGGQISVTVSHELLEMLADPEINLSAEADLANDTRFYAYEVADAVEADADGYEIEIPAGWNGAGQKIAVSDFVTPEWFMPSNVAGPFDFMKHLLAPLQLRPGGYISFLDLNNLSQGWQQVTGRMDNVRAMSMVRARPGSRRHRRTLRRRDWIVSQYEVGSEALPAQQP